MFLAAALLFVVPKSYATTFVAQPFTEAVQETPVVVRGKIGMSYANWSMGSDGSKKIFTYSELAIEEVLKGTIETSNRTLIIRELGGEKDGVGMEVPGTAQFKRGEDVVVFLGPENLDGSRDIINMMMGKYALERGEDGKEYLVGAGVKSVTPPPRELRDHPDDHSKGEEKGGQDDTRLKKWSLDMLRELIKSQGAAPPAAQNPAKPLSVATEPLPVSTEFSATEQAAPQLQPQGGAEEGEPNRPYLLAGALIFAAIAGGIAWRILRKT